MTIATEQKRFIDQRIRERGLEDLVDIRLQDYRDVPERDHYDAVGSLEMGEHVGEHHYPSYVEVLRRAVRPGGRVLVQQMSADRTPSGRRPVHRVVHRARHAHAPGGRDGRATSSAAGLEVRDVHALREHYVRTVAGWLANFESHLPELTALVGEEVVRVWRLYLVGGSLAFRDGRMGVDQILCVRPGGEHTVPFERAW